MSGTVKLWVKDDSSASFRHHGETRRLGMDTSLQFFLLTNDVAYCVPHARTDGMRTSNLEPLFHLDLGWEIGCCAGRLRAPFRHYWRIEKVGVTGSI